MELIVLQAAESKLKFADYKYFSISQKNKKLYMYVVGELICRQFSILYAESLVCRQNLNFAGGICFIFANLVKHSCSFKLLRLSFLNRVANIATVRKIKVIMRN